MSEKIMKNFPIEYEGNIYWRSRSCTTVGFVFCQDKDGYWCILANQRGPGAPTNIGKWNVPCGYIDYNEDGNHGVARETFEETGVKINPESFNFDSVTFSKNDEQNINLRYWVILDGTIDTYPLSNEANEEGETSDIKWIPIEDIDKYEWAFGHEKAIPDMFEKNINRNKTKYLVELRIFNNETLQDPPVDTATLGICDSIEKCKEIALTHVNRMVDANEKVGISHNKIDTTNQDILVNWTDGEQVWLYWYIFKFVQYYA